jgi:hypothetical protein
LIKIDDIEIESHHLEYGVEIVPGTIIECDDEQEAREKAATLGGKVFVRHVYETKWADI